MAAEVSTVKLVTQLTLAAIVALWVARPSIGLRPGWLVGQLRRRMIVSRTRCPLSFGVGQLQLRVVTAPSLSRDRVRLPGEGLADLATKRDHRPKLALLCSPT